MKLTIERNALLKALSHVQNVVERRNTIPILSNVLLQAHEGKLSLTATDMDVDVVERINANVGESGAVTAPAHMLYDIIRKLPEGSEVGLELNAEKTRLQVKAGRSSFALPTLGIEEFPVIAGDNLPFEFNLYVTELKALIDRTRFAISTEETRYYLNGIYVHTTQNNEMPVLRAVATDGHRLARVEMPLPEGANGMPGIIIPRKTVNELRKLLDEGETVVRVAASDTRIRFTLGGVVLSSKLIDGTFPDYDRVIPVANDKEMVVSRKSFAEAVDRVATISTDRMRAIKLALQNGQLVLSATGTDSSTATEALEVTYAADAMEIGFNSKYLLDVALQIEGDGVCFTLADSGAPTIIKDPADTSALYVLMPMRV